MIDPFHLETYGEMAINYNRDVEAFPIIRRILEKIMEEGAVYKSPTDMGVNRAGFGIVDDDVVKDAAKQEVIRRFFRCQSEYMLGFADKETVERSELIMNELGVGPSDRIVVGPARDAAVDAEKKKKGNEGIFCGAAMELHDGTILTGKNTPLMHAASSLVLNAVKHLSEIPDKIHLLSPHIIDSVTNFRKNILKAKSVSLDVDELLILLSMSAATNPMAQTALEKIAELDGCEVHMTHIPTLGDEAGLRRLGVNLTTDPSFATKKLHRT